MRRRFIIILSILFVLFTIYLLQDFSRHLHSEGRLVGFELDKSFPITKEVVDKTLERLSDADRAAYIKAIIWLDFPFLVIYNLFFLLVIVQLIAIMRFHPWVRKAYILPVITAMGDTAENIGILFILYDYPSLSDFWLGATAVGNLLKWVFFSLSLLTVFTLFIKLFVPGFRLSR